jgi:hypothetical protein
MPEVPGGSAVDVIAAVAFLLFVLSIVSAAVAELISSAFNWRGKMLRRALGRLLGEGRAEALYASPRIALLHGPRGRLPSYIPAAAVGGEEGGRFDDLMSRVSGWYKRRVQ